MALPTSLLDREFDKFEADAFGNTAVRTLLTIGPLTIGAVEIEDSTSGIKADVVATGPAYNGLCVALAGAGGVVGTTGNALDINIKSGMTLEVHLDHANDDVLIYGNDGLNDQKIHTDASGDVQVDVLSLPAVSGTVAVSSLPAIPHDTLSSGTDSVSAVPRRTPTVTSATGAGAIAATTAIGANFRLTCITLHLSGVPIASEDLTFSLNANDGPAYDVVFLSVDPSVVGESDYVYTPNNDLLFESGDEIVVSYPNTNANTYGLRIVTEAI